MSPTLWLRSNLSRRTTKRTTTTSTTKPAGAVCTATAITAGMRIDELSQLDLAYAPPFNSLWDPLLVAAQAVLRKL